MRDLLKKWWFWLILLVMLIIIVFTIIILWGFNTINPDKNFTKFAKELQDYDNNITLYQSAGKNTILIESINQSSEEIAKKSEEIGKIIGEQLNDLIAYKNILFNFYTTDGDKETFSFDVKTGQIEKESVEDWILKDSIAESNVQSEIKELEEKKITLNTQISSLENKKSDLDTKIEKLNSDIIKIKGEPKTYPAGYLTAGTDFETGRYKIYDGTSNFVVYSILGDLRVNIILGGRTGVNEYIYTFSNGDKVKSNSSFKMVQVN